jgi:IS4 transposase
LQSYLPSFVIIDTAAEHENTRAREVCAGLKSGEIAVFDKGYIDFEHLNDLNQRGVFWVTRAKDSMAYTVVRTLNEASGKVLRDVLIRFHYHNAKRAYPQELRLVETCVEVEGKPTVMTFITNNFQWQPQSVADLYRCRWQIELFFKSLKQNLQVADFLGYSANAVRWQVWTALLVHLLLRFLAWQSRWTSYFGRVFTLVRATLWRRLDLLKLLELYGTAGANKRMCTRPEQAFLPGLC